MFSTLRLKQDLEPLCLQIFRNHLATMFMYDFPEHYGEVLSLALRHSETQSLAPDVWYDLVNAMVGGSRLHPGLSLAQLKEVINQYATEQRALSVQEVGLHKQKSCFCKSAFIAIQEH